MEKGLDRQIEHLTEGYGILSSAYVPCPARLESLGKQPAGRRHCVIQRNQIDGAVRLSGNHWCQAMVNEAHRVVDRSELHHFACDGIANDSADAAHSNRELIHPGPNQLFRFVPGRLICVDEAHMMIQFILVDQPSTTPGYMRGADVQNSFQVRTTRGEFEDA